MTKAEGKTQAKRALRNTPCECADIGCHGANGPRGTCVASARAILREIEGAKGADVQGEG